MNAAAAGFTELAVVNWSIQGVNVLVAELFKGLDGTELPEWEAGAHIDIQATDRMGHEVVRQYSLCSRHGEKHWRIAVLGDPHGSGASLNLQNDIKAGQTLQARGPRNLFALPSDDHPVVLVAGGIGITPILAMAETLSAQKRKFRLHYHARSHESAAFVEEIKSSSYASNVTFSFDDEGSSSIDQIFSNCRCPCMALYLWPGRLHECGDGCCQSGRCARHKNQKRTFWRIDSSQFQEDLYVWIRHSPSRFNQRVPWWRCPWARRQFRHFRRRALRCWCRVNRGIAGLV
jgi:hypothetical protein